MLYSIPLIIALALMIAWLENADVQPDIYHPHILSPLPTRLPFYCSFPLWLIVLAKQPIIGPMQSEAMGENGCDSIPGSTRIAMKSVSEKLVLYIYIYASIRAWYNILYFCVTHLRMVNGFCVTDTNGAMRGWGTGILGYLLYKTALGEVDT